MISVELANKNLNYWTLYRGVEFQAQVTMQSTDQCGI